MDWFLIYFIINYTISLRWVLEKDYKKYKTEVVKLNDLLHNHKLIEKDKDLVEILGYERV